MTWHRDTAVIDRFRFLFTQSQDAFAKDMRGVMSEMAQRNLLNSSITIEKTVEALTSRSSQAITQSLDAISRATSTPGRRRRRLATALERQLENHWARIGEQAWAQIGRPEWGRSRQSFDEFREYAWPKVLAPIGQYRNGWTDPTAEPWKDRHPMLYSLVIALLSALVGAAIASLALPRVDVTAFWTSHVWKSR